MKLQVAFDVKTYSELKSIMDKIYGYVDILEVGTLLIKSEGKNVIKKAKVEYGLPVFADMKCQDGGKGEVEIAAENGADYVTILVGSYPENIKEFVDTCKAYGVKSVVDSICDEYTNNEIERVVRKLVRAQNLGIDIVELHTGYMNKVGVRSFDDLKEFYPKATVPLFISGGMSSKKIWEIEPYVKKIDTVVVGRAIRDTPDPKGETRKIKETINSF